MAGDLQAYAGKRVLITGGGDSAVDWALALERIARSVTLIHRREGFRAHDASVNALQSSKVDVRLFNEIRELQGKDRLERVVIFDNRSRHDEAIVDSATVRFKGLTAQRIDAILADGTAMGCAGGIMVEHPLFQPLVDRIFGDPQTVQGLPGRLVEVALRSLYV